MSFSVTVKNNVDFGRIERLATTASREALGKAVRIVAAEARRQAPRGDPADRAWKMAKRKGSPELRRSIRTKTGKRKIIDGLFYGAVYTTDGTGTLIELGTGMFHQHHEGACRAGFAPIRAKKRGGFMVFPSIGGWLIRVREVKGRRATPFLASALKAKAGRVIKALKDGLNR